MSCVKRTEKRFPFLKGDAWVSAFFVKSPEHVEALGYVLLLALMLWSVWERRVRRNLAASGGPPLREPTGIKHTKPTAQACANIMAGVRLVRVVEGSCMTPWRLAGPLTGEQTRLVALSGRCMGPKVEDVVPSPDGGGGGAMRG